MSTLLQDVAYAVRVAMRRPGLTLVTILTLALGIGGSSAIFSLINGLFLRPLPVEHPEELVRIFGEQDGRPYDVSSFANLSDLSTRTHTLSEVVIHQQTTSAYGLGDASATVNVELVSGNYFSMLGVQVLAGRGLSPEDDVNGDPKLVAVVSDAWWRTRLGRRANVVGETIYLNGSPFTVIGVAPQGFRGSYDALGTDWWVPLMAYETVRPRRLPITRRGWGWLSATARLRPGATLAQAQADVDTVVAGLITDYPRENAGLKMNLVPASALPEDLGPTLRRVLLFALLVATLALAAACANVANAQMATVLDRRREIAVRLAMGASRARIARQWLTESLLIAGVAAGVGTIGALWMQDALAAIGPPNGLSNFAPAQSIDVRLVLFSAAVVGIVTVLFGGIPASRAARVDVAGPLKDDATSTTASSRRGWAQAALVSAQVAVSVALLVSSALLTRSMSASRAFDVGFDTRNLVIAAPNVANLGFDATRGRLYYSDTLARVRASPGVMDVALAAVVPLGDGDESIGASIDGYTPPDGTAVLSISNNFVSPNYFDSMRIPIRQGRGFAPADGEENARVVVVVNETMARRYWADGHPVGRTIRIAPYGPVEVIGVAADITYRVPGEEPRPFLYLPFGPAYFPYGLAFHVRAAGADPSLARALTRELRAFDARVQVPTAMPYDQLRQAALYPGRTLAIVSSAFGVVALLLSVAGIYGVIVHVVASRNREFAVRLALGARPQALVRRVLGQGLRWSLVGVGAGTALAVLMAQLLKAYLFGVSTADAVSIGGTAAAMVLVSLAAAYAAARRVLAIDPAEMLRQ